MSRQADRWRDNQYERQDFYKPSCITPENPDSVIDVKTGANDSEALLAKSESGAWILVELFAKEKALPFASLTSYYRFRV